MVGLPDRFAQVCRSRLESLRCTYLYAGPALHTQEIWIDDMLELMSAAVRGSSHVIPRTVSARIAASPREFVPRVTTALAPLVTRSDHRLFLGEPRAGAALIVAVVLKCGCCCGGCCGLVRLLSCGGCGGALLMCATS